MSYFYYSCYLFYHFGLTVVQFTILFISYYFTSSNTSIPCGGVVVAVISTAAAAVAAITLVCPTIVLVRICLFVS